MGALIDDGIHIGLAPNVHARVNSRNRCLVNCHPLAPTAAECYPWKGNGALAPGCYPRRELAPVGQMGRGGALAPAHFMKKGTAHGWEGGTSPSHQQ